MRPLFKKVAEPPLYIFLNRGHSKGERSEFKAYNYGVILPTKGKFGARRARTYAEKFGSIPIIVCLVYGQDEKVHE